MGERLISESQRHWLSRELSDWQQAGIVDADTASVILAQYQTSAEIVQRKQSWAVYALLGVASVFVGLAALLLVGYNWQALHWVAKLAIVFGVIIVTQTAAFYLRFRTQAQTLAEVLFFLGCLFYGAGIFLVAQIFNLNSHYPDGVWWWALGVLPFALCLDTVLLHLLFASLLALWAGMEVIDFSSLVPWWFGRWLPNGAYLLLPLAVLGLAWAYRKPSAFTVAIYVALLAWWSVLQMIAWDLGPQSVYLIGMMGATMWIIAENHEPRSPMAVPYRVYGTLLICGGLIPASFADFQSEMRRLLQYHWHNAQLFAEMTLFILQFAALLASALLLKPLGNEVRGNPFARLIDVARRQWVPMGIMLANCLMAALSLGTSNSLVLATIIANVAMVVFAVYLIRIGLREERGILFTVGVGYLLLWSILRYADLFGDMGGMLGAALMFFLCGALLFALAMLWGKRKEIKHVQSS